MRQFYQVDFVAGQPIENLSADRLYAQQDRLLRFAFGTYADGIVETVSAWPDARIRGCLAESGISEDDDGTVEATFTVVEGCELTLSLAVYSLPGAEFDVDTADRQELLNATTGTYGPGERTITVELPVPPRSSASSRRPIPTATARSRTTTWWRSSNSSTTRRSRSTRRRTTSTATAG